MSLSFEHVALGQRVLFGTGKAAANLAAEVARLGAQRVMVIAGAYEASIANDITAGIDVTLNYDDVAPHVPVEKAEKARTAAAEHGIDLLVCVGGGSTTGLAKAIAMTTRLPIVAIPTTYAGSEATNVWGLTETSRKTTGVDDNVLPVTVIYDAALTLSLPVELSVASGLNGMAHCIDSMWAPRADPINAALAAEGIRALAAGLPLIKADSQDAAGREQALYGAYLSAVAFASAGSGMHHKICHVLGGAYNLPHAQTHATVLPYVLAFNAPYAPEAAARIAAAFRSDTAVAGLNGLREVLDAPRALKDYGLTEENIPEAVQLILPAIPASNPREVTAENLEALLRAAWAGTTRQASRPARLLNPVTTGKTAMPQSTETRQLSPDQTAVEQQLVDTVVASFDKTGDPRLKQLMQSLTRHLHNFLREVRLTEDEWNAGIEFLTAAGHITDDKRQEFILLSDVLGASMQTIAINNQAYRGATEATVFGPFFIQDAPEIPNGGDIAGGAAGQPCWVEGTVNDTDGDPVPGARIEVWEADEDGFYDVQYTDGRVAGRAHLYTDDEGKYAFWGLTPTPYPIPHDGPVGQMLEATHRSPVRASHLHFMVTAPKLRTLVTHIFVEGDPQIEIGDSVFGVKDSLIKRFEPQPAGTPVPDGRDLGGQAWARARFDVVLAPAEI